MNTVPCVVRLLAEGGVIQVFGRKEPDGSWIFSAQSQSLDLDDAGNERVVVGGSPRVTDLAEVLPPSWVSYLPTQIHPDLRDWFRERYAAAVAALPESFRESQATFRHPKWQAIFESTPPDRWSSDDRASAQDFPGF